MRGGGCYLLQLTRTSYREDLPSISIVLWEPTDNIWMDIVHHMMWSVLMLTLVQRGPTTWHNQEQQLETMEDGTTTTLVYQPNVPIFCSSDTRLTSQPLLYSMY